MSEVEKKENALVTFKQNIHTHICIYICVYTYTLYIIYINICYNVMLHII